ncbi:Dynein heavy chain 6 [Blattella germanica]|nr:Dynein heavy chain 6 [Blattella germanica]
MVFTEFNIFFQSVADMTIRFFEEMRRHYYITPSSYLELIKLYKGMLQERKDQTNKKKDRISNGLQEELVALEPELQQKSTATAELMKHLVKEQAQVDKVRQIVVNDEAIVKLRVFNKPPNLVKFVMESVCLLLGQKLDWATAKLVLGDTNFLKKLQEYDKNNITDPLMKKLKVYVEHPDFIPEKVATQSKVCKSMCMWVRAIDSYAKVYRVVEPKRKRLETAEKELNEIMGILREKQQRLAEVEQQIAELEAMYDASLAEKMELEHTIDLTSNRLIRAGRLTSALGDEQVRWESSVKVSNFMCVFLLLVV